MFLKRVLDGKQKFHRHIQQITQAEMQLAQAISVSAKIQFSWPTEFTISSLPVEQCKVTRRSVIFILRVSRGKQTSRGRDR